MSMTSQEKSQWKLYKMHVEQMEYHRKIASALLEGFLEMYDSEEIVVKYNQEIGSTISDALGI